MPSVAVQSIILPGPGQITCRRTTPGAERAYERPGLRVADVSRASSWTPRSGGGAACVIRAGPPPSRRLGRAGRAAAARRYRARARRARRRPRRRRGARGREDRVGIVGIGDPRGSGRAQQLGRRAPGRHQCQHRALRREVLVDLAREHREAAAVGAWDQQHQHVGGLHRPSVSPCGRNPSIPRRSPRPRSSRPVAIGGPELAEEPVRRRADRRARRGRRATGAACAGRRTCRRAAAAAAARARRRARRRPRSRTPFATTLHRGPGAGEVAASRR